MKASRFQLPSTFYLYESKPPCKGCRGCVGSSDNDILQAEGSTSMVGQLGLKDSTVTTSSSEVPNFGSGFGNATGSSPSSGFGSAFSGSTFAALASNKASGFGGVAGGSTFSGAGAQLFGGGSTSKQDGAEGVGDDYDPHYEAIVEVKKLDDVKTGEEDDEAVFKHRAKLYRFDKQWKERGVGDIKLTKNAKTGYCRVLMRRDHIHKLCANHAIMPTMELKPLTTSDVAWVWFTPSDYSEGLPPQPIQFCVKFKKKEVAEEFRKNFAECQEWMKVKLDQDEEEKEAHVHVEQKLQKEEVTKTENVSAQNVSPFASFSFGAPRTTTTTGNNASPFASLTSFGGGSEPSLSKGDVLSTSTEKPNEEVRLEPKSPGYYKEEGDDDIHVEAIVQVSKLETVRTGEENEETLFENRSKLFRFDSDAKQWKERGLGEIKVTKNAKTGSCRLLMRREQIHKLCANHAIVANMELKPMNNSGKSWTWLTQADFSEEEAKPEFFCAKFKTADIASEFKEQFEKCIEMVGGKQASSTVKPSATVEQKQPKTTSDATPEAKRNPFSKFVTASGSWNCDTCLVPNPATEMACLACQTPKPCAEPAVAKTPEPPKSTFLFNSSGDSSSKFSNMNGFSFTSPTSQQQQSTAPPAFSFSQNNQTSSSTSPAFAGFSFGSTSSASTINSTNLDASNTQKTKAFSKFAPKEGSWECPTCMVSNTSDDSKCEACETPNPNAAPPKSIEVQKSSSEAPSFSFSKGSGNAFAKFAPKEGSWECQTCMVSNTSDASKCEACDTPNPNAPPPKDTAESNPQSAFNFKPTTGNGGFSFGGGDSQSLSNSNFGTPSSGFSFGATNQFSKNPSSGFTFGSAAQPTSSAGFSFGTPQQSTTGSSGFLFGSAAPVAPASSGFTFGAPTKTEHASSNIGKDTNKDQPVAYTSKSSGNGFAKFAPKDGSWECQTCMISNTEDLSNCEACETPNPNAASVKSTEVLKSSSEAPSFSFSKGSGNAFAKFAPKEGSWECPTCMVSNTSDDSKCEACETPNPNALPPKEQHKPLFGSATTNENGFFRFGQSNDTSSSGSGFSFGAKPKSEGGDGIVKKIPFGDNPNPFTSGFKFSPAKDVIFGGGAATDKLMNQQQKPSSGIPFSSQQSSSTSVFGGFSFGGLGSINSTSQNTTISPGVTPVQETTISSSTTPKVENSATSNQPPAEDRFAADPDTWECVCLIKNAGHRCQCRQCGTARQKTPVVRLNPEEHSQPINFNASTQQQKQPFVFSVSVPLTTPTSTDSFSSGRATPSKPSLPKVETQKKDDGFAVPTGLPSFSSFGGPATNSNNSNSKTSTSSVAATTKSWMPSGLNTGNLFSFGSIPKPSLSNASSVDDLSVYSTDDKFSSVTSAFADAKFSFTFEPTTTGSTDNATSKTPSPTKNKWKTPTSPTSADYNPEDREPNIEFSPLVTLSQLNQQATGEEDEICLFANRCKMFRYDAAQWKERGVGEVKILSNTLTGHRRLIMRRDQIHKLCANHGVFPGIEIKAMKGSAKSFVWQAIGDISDEESKEMMLAARFRDEDIAGQFFKAVTEGFNKESGSMLAADKSINDEFAGKVVVISDEEDIQEEEQGQQRPTPLQDNELSITYEFICPKELQIKARRLLLPSSFYNEPTVRLAQRPSKTQSLR